jgi:hypothetical protein
MILMKPIIKPTRTPTGAFSIQFRSPLAPDNPESADVGRDEAHARATATVMTNIVNDPAICQALEAEPSLKRQELGRGPATRRALEISYGPIIEQMFSLSLTQKDLDTVAARVAATLVPVEGNRGNVRASTWQMGARRRMIRVGGICMRAVRIHTRLTSDRLPELGQFIGKNVEIIIFEEPSVTAAPAEASGKPGAASTAGRAETPLTTSGTWQVNVARSGYHLPFSADE